VTIMKVRHAPAVLLIVLAIGCSFILVTGMYTAKKVVIMAITNMNTISS